MKKFAVRFLLGIVLMPGLVQSSYADRPTAAPTCTITTRSATIQGGTLSYDSAGQGSTVLLLHGLFASKEQWNTIMCRLATAGYRAIAPDLPGYGNSQGFATETYALERQTALLHEFTQGMGIKTLDVAGSSMGGAIATLYAQQHPTQVRSLAFVGAPVGVVGWAAPLRNAIYQGINPFIPITKEQFDLEISLLFVNPPQIPDSVKAQKVNDYINRNRHYQQVWDIVNLYTDVTCKARLRALPTLAIWGRNDKIYDISGADRLQKCLPRSTVWRLPDAGHLLLVENADTAATIYLGFLAKVPSATPAHQANFELVSQDR